MAMGEILGALLGKAIKTGVQGYNKAGQLRDYSRALNYGMPEEQKVPQFGNRFYFGDVEQYAKALDAAQKNRGAQAEAQYYADRGGLPMGPRDAVKQVYTGEYMPAALERQKMKDKRGQSVNEGWEEYQTQMVLEGMMPQNIQPFTPASPMPQMPLPPQGQQQLPPNQFPEPIIEPYSQDYGPNPYSEPVMQGGVSQTSIPMPQRPEWFAMSPETLRNYNTMQTTRRGQDVTMRGQDLTQQFRDKSLALQKRRTDAYINNLAAQTGIRREQLKQGWARIAKMTGRAPSKVEVAQDMLRRGEINKAEFKKFVLSGGKDDQPVNIFGDNANIDMGDDGGAVDVDAAADAYLNGQ